MKFLSQSALHLGAVGLAILAATGVSAQEKSVTIGLTSDPSHLYPLAGEELSSNIMYYHLYDPLVKRSADLSFGPGPLVAPVFLVQPLGNFLPRRQPPPVRPAPKRAGNP